MLEDVQKESVASLEAAGFVRQTATVLFDGSVAYFLVEEEGLKWLPIRFDCGFHLGKKGSISASCVDRGQVWVLSVGFFFFKEVFYGCEVGWASFVDCWGGGVFW